MAKRELTVLVFLEATVLSMFCCTPVEATNRTISGCPTVFGCVCVSPTDVTCNGVPAIVTLPLANMSLQEVPRFEGVYEDVRTIDLGNNSITRIPRASFTSTHFPSLVEIILIDNSISRVEIDAFQVSRLATLDLRENRLQEFTVGSFTQFTGPSFSSLLLEDNQIQTVSGVTRPRFTRESFPVLIIHLSGNTPPCEAEFFVSLCPFLEDGDAVCTEGTELLTIQPDVCLVMDMPDDESNSNSNSSVIIGGVVGGVLGIILVILLLALLVVCFRLKMWEKKFDDVHSQQKTQQLIQKPVPPTRPLSSPRYTGSPEQHCRVDPGATGDQERIYAEIGLPSRPFSEIPVEELYYDSNGYILKIDSIPPKQDKQVSVVLEGASEGATPQAYETPISVSTLRMQKNPEKEKDEKNKPLIDSTNLDDYKEKEGASEKAEMEGLEKSPSNDEKKKGNYDSVYLQMIV